MVCKTIKRGVLATLVGAGLLGLVFGTSATSYVKTAFHKARSTVKESVPMQFEIDRARQQVAELEPAIRDNIEAIARAEVEIEYLDREIASTRQNLDQEAKALVALRNHLEDGDLILTGGASYSDAEIQGEMARRLDHYRTIKSILEDKEKTLNLRKKALLSAREQNAKMGTAKMALLTEIEGIETRLRQIEATQATNEFTFDDSALARAKQTVADLNKRVEVMARISEQEGRYSGEGLPLILEPGRDVRSEVDAEFGLSKPHSVDRTHGKTL